MPRIARVVVPEYPHHVTQRGSRKQQTFYTADDCRFYLQLLAKYKVKYGVEIWAYCLMPNHVHLIVVPSDEKGLAKCLAQTHRRYALRINDRNNWRGHLWQERFYSFVMDEAHLMSAVRYVELNPVRANLCEAPGAWLWSSARAHMLGIDDHVTDTKPMLERVSDWRVYLNGENNEKEFESIRKHTRTGRPAGTAQFIDNLEAMKSLGTGD